MDMSLQALPAGDSDAPGSIRILIVDDEATARETLGDVLSGMGYSVRAAGTAAEALEQTRLYPFDVALLDIRLPDMDGTALLKELKAQQPEVACVMVTAYASFDSSVDALNEGACAYVLKPFDMAQIQSVVREQVEKQRLSRENRRMMQTLQALQALSDVALATLDPSALPSRLLERFVAATGGQAGSLVILPEEHEPARGLLRVGGTGGQLATRAMEEAAAFLSPEGEKGPFLAVPLMVHQQAVGGIEVQAGEGCMFTRRDLHLAELLADRTALALENARLHERERSSAREAQTLLRVAEALVSALHLSDRLHIIAKTLAEVAGCDRCLVYLLRNGGLAPARAFGITADETLAFQEMGAGALAAGGTIRRALETGKPAFLTESPDEPEAIRQFLHCWRLRSALALPLLVGSSAIGVAVIDATGREGAITPRDVRLCEAVASQAAIAIENARAFERQRNIAEVLQQSFLPDVPERLGALRLAARYHPALKDARVGGDFYDWMRLPDGRIGLLIADVSGKGVNAAVHAAMGKYMLRAFAFEHPDPADALQRLNVALFTYGSHEVFITMFFAAIDGVTGDVVYASAGHPPGLLVRGTDPNRMVRLGSTGAPIGAFRDAVFTHETTRLASGDMLVLYTDGVTEARSDQEFFGVERLEDVLAEYVRRGPEATADAIHAAVQKFAGGAAHDDVALIIAQATLGTRPVG